MMRVMTLMALCAFAAVAEDKPAMPAPPAEMSVEKWFVGTWNCSGQQHAGPFGPEMKTSSQLVAKLELGGFWLDVKGTALSGPMKGKEMFHGFASWDGSQHQRYDFELGGLSHYTTKGWDGDKVVFDGDSTMGGQKMSVRHTMTKKGDSQFGSVIEIDGKPIIEETCKKAAAKAK